MNTDTKETILHLLHDTIESQIDLYRFCEEFTFHFAHLEEDEFKSMCTELFDTASERLMSPPSDFITLAQILSYSDLYNEIHITYQKLTESNQN